MIIPYKIAVKTLKYRGLWFELIYKTGWKPFLRNILPQPLSKSILDTHLRELLEFPTVIQIEVTNACNAKCWFCSQPNSGREKGYMEFGLFKKIVDEIAPFSRKIKAISFFMDGEPTLNPNILKFLKYANMVGIQKINLSSNMEFFTPELTNSILDSNLGNALQYVICSLDGASEKVHSKNRIGVDFDKALLNTEYLISKKNQMKKIYPWVFTRLLVSDITKREIGKFKKTWGKKADKVLCSPMHNWGGQLKDKRLIVNNNHKEFYPCYFPFSQFAIQYDGAVRLCCLDTNESTIIGNMKKNKITEIWNGIKINEIRNLHLKKKIDELPDICVNCSYPQRGTWVAPFYW